MLGAGVGTAVVTTAYRRGYDLERRVALHLIGLGWVVVASRGSHGIADLVALRAGAQPLVVQVKRDRHTMSSHDCRLLVAHAQKAGASPVIADSTGPRPSIRLFRLLADRPRRDPDRPLPTPHRGGVMEAIAVSGLSWIRLNTTIYSHDKMLALL